MVAFLLTLALIKEKESPPEAAAAPLTAQVTVRPAVSVPSAPVVAPPPRPVVRALERPADYVLPAKVEMKLKVKESSDKPVVSVKESPPQNLEQLNWPREVKEAAQADQPVVRSGFEREEFRPGPERLIYVKPHSLYPEGGWIRYRRYSDIQDNGQEKVRFYTGSGHKVVERAAVEWNEEIRVE